MSTSLGAAIRGPSRRKRGGMAVVSGPRFPPGWPLVIGLASTAAQDSISAPKSRRFWPGAVSSFCGVILALRCEVNRAGAADGIGQRLRRPGDCSADPSVPCLPLAFGCALLSCRHEHASGGRGAGGRAGVGRRRLRDRRCAAGRVRSRGHCCRHWRRRCAGPGALVEAAGHGDPPGALEHRRHRPERAHQRGAGVPGGSSAAAPACQAYAGFRFRGAITTSRPWTCSCSPPPVSTGAGAAARGCNRPPGRQAPAESRPVRVLRRS